MTEEEVEVVARAINPAEWRQFDDYVRRMGLDAAAQAAARKHRHGHVRASLLRARAVIEALDESSEGVDRRIKPGEDAGGVGFHSRPNCSSIGP